MLSDVRTESTAYEGLSIAVDATTDLDHPRLILDDADLASASLASWIGEEATQNLNFSECVPPDRVQAAIAQPTRDDAAVMSAAAEPRSSISFR